MQIRQIISVKNHSVTVILPDDFIADEVEVIFCLCKMTIKNSSMAN